MNYHLRSRHSEQYSKFLECKAETEKDRATKSTEKKKKADGDGLNQLKLKKDGNQLGIQNKSNPAAQRRFNIATAQMVSKGFLSFRQAEGIKLLTQ